MKKILVIEDNEANLYLIRFILEKNNFLVIPASSGEEGIKLAEQKKPDLIIMDILLPGMDGLEATKKIRASSWGKKLSIVALTSYAMVGDKEEALAAGCTGYLEKPINPETFVQDISKHL